MGLENVNPVERQPPNDSATCGICPAYRYSGKFRVFLHIRYSSTRLTIPSAIAFIKTDTQRAKSHRPIRQQIRERRKFLPP